MEEPEEKKDIAPPIINSLSKDTGGVSATIVKNDAVPNEEAKMLANIASVSSRQRKIRSTSAMAFVVIVASIVVFFVPDLFLNKKDSAPVVAIVDNKSLIKTDIGYNLEMPAEVEYPEFRNKVFKSTSPFAEFVLTKNNEKVLLPELAPFVSERFLKSLDGIRGEEYVYGTYTNNDKVSYPFFVFNILANKRDQTETVLKNGERTLYRDLGVILQLPDSPENENLDFKSFESVRSPLRELVNGKGETIFVYGFANDEIVVFTTSREIFNILKERIVNGY